MHCFPVFSEVVNLNALILKLFISYTMLIHFCCCYFLVTILQHILQIVCVYIAKNLTNEECEAIVCLTWTSQSPALYTIEHP